MKKSDTQPTPRKSPPTELASPKFKCVEKIGRKEWERALAKQREKEIANRLPIPVIFPGRD